MRDQKQTAYQVLAASNVETLISNRGDKWDSGWIESNRSVNISYGGAPLKSREICYWKVRIKDGNGKISPWSEPSLCEIGLLEESDWQSQWIGCADITFGHFPAAKNFAGFGVFDFLPLCEHNKNHPGHNFG